MRHDRGRVFCPGDVQYLAMVAGVSTVLLTLAILSILGAFTMKRSLHILALGAALALSGCATAFDPAKFAAAANDLDPNCYKHVEITVTPMLVFGWAVPIPSGRYVKTCNPDQAKP